MTCFNEVHPLNIFDISVKIDKSKCEKSTILIFSTLGSASIEKKDAKFSIWEPKYIFNSEPAFIFNTSLICFSFPSK